MSAIRFAGAMCVLALVWVPASTAGSQDAFGDAAAVIQFQRSVDAYAFQHRQVHSRLGKGADQRAMAEGMRAARPSAADGDVFTPIVGAAFRTRIAMGLRRQACRIPAPDSASYEVPRVGAPAAGSQPLPACLSNILPRLPEELEYRISGVTIALLDTHADMVVDVLHAALPAPEER